MGDRSLRFVPRPAARSPRPSSFAGTVLPSLSGLGILCLLCLLGALVPAEPGALRASQAQPALCERAGFSPGSGIMWQSDADLARDLDEMVSAGAQWVRLDLSWSSIERKKGVYDWSNVDRVFKAVGSRNLKILGILLGTPAWARGPETDYLFYPPTDPVHFANFAAATVTRYSGQVKFWEVWNEPNISSFWKPAPDVVAYTTLLKLAYSAMKKADAGATVLSAGLSPAADEPDGSRVAPTTFLARMYENGAKGSFDILGFHPYSYPKRPIDPATESYNAFHHIPRLYDLMVRNGDGDKKMWLTEFGAPLGTAKWAVTEAEQAAIIADGFRAAVQMPGVGGPFFVYSLRDRGIDPAEREDNFGVLRRDFSPKLSRAAYQQAAAACVLPQPATLSISDASVVEGTPAVFTITRTGDTTGTSTVQYSTASGTATAGSDFVGIGLTTVTFAAGETSKTVTVTVNGGVDLEPDETFSVKLSSPTGASISDDTGLGTILNDDAPPTLAVNDVAVVEGDSGTTSATFTITRSGITAHTSSVVYVTRSGTASGGSDFVGAGPITVQFAEGETSKTVTVGVKGDIDVEPDETFTVKLSSPDAAVIADDTGVATIINDDGPATLLSVDDPSVSEGLLGGATATFTITRSGVTSGSSSVRYATADGTATAGSDYTAVGPAAVTFAAGETTKTVAVPILADLLDEPNETVLLNLSSPVGAAITDAQGVATIVDDDLLLGVLEAPAPATFIAVSDAVVTEGNSGTSNARFTITRLGVVSTVASSVQYATAAGTATAGSDFVSAGPTTVNFAAAETVKIVTVAVNGDTMVEPTETFSLKLSSPSGAVIADDTGTATIFDDDVLPTVGISDTSLTEGSSGTAAAIFTIIRSGITAGTSSVQYATVAGTATAGSDFVGVAGTTVNFAAGEMAKTVTVSVNGDTAPEGVETFSVKLSSPTNATISDDTGVATIFDDDAPPTVAVSDVAVPAGATDGWAIFSVTRSGNTSSASSVKYATAAGTATEGTDYVGIAPTTLHFAEHETVKIVPVNVKAQASTDETFSLNLSSPTGAAVADGQGGAQLVPGPTSVAATAGARYNPLTPARILDTRFGNGAPAAKVGPGMTLDLQVTGRGGVPASGVSAVVLNLTVVEPSVAGYVTAFPTGEARPVASNLNFSIGQTRPNLAVVKLGTGGKVSLYNPAGTVHLLADVAGWYDAGTATSGARYNPLTPARILDTRFGNGAPTGKLGPASTLDLQVTGRGGVPASGVSAVVLNVTGVEATTNSYLTAFPTGEARPATSNLNYVTSQTVPNLVMVKVGAGGKVSLYNNLGTVHVIADVAGWYDAGTATTGARYNPLTPARILDTRSGNGAPAEPLGPAATLDLQVTGRGGVPASGVSAVVLNVTITGPSANSYLTAFPTGEARPATSNLNYTAGQTMPNLVVVKVGAEGKVSLYNNVGTVPVIADVAGWYDAG